MAKKKDKVIKWVWIVLVALVALSTILALVLPYVF
jgi:hypothetical protein